MKPIVGIITRPDHLSSGNQVDVIYSHIRSSIVKFGGIPLAITVPTETIYDCKTSEEVCSFDSNTMNDLKSILSLCNGFVFQGGDSFYDYDIKILEYAYLNNIPSLGICLGMQLMCVYKKGQLKKIKKHYKKKRYVHDIIIQPDSKLYSILGTEKCCVNSRHHDCVDNTNLKIVAQSKDGVIEAVEDSEKHFFIGVQWHPEDMITYDTVMRKLWRSFLIACKENVYGGTKIN